MTLFTLWVALMIGQGGQRWISCTVMQDGVKVSDCTFPVPQPKPESQDVPAIRQDYRYRYNEMQDMVWTSHGFDCSENGKVVPCRTRIGVKYKWQCADKTRILEHDEQTPAKYYCRKPQVEDGK